MAPKRILFYCGGSHVAGVEILTLSIMRELRSRGHEIHCLVSGWNDGDFVNRLEAEGIPYDSLKLGFLYVRRPLWTLDTLLHYPGAALRHWRIQRRFRPDIAWHVSYRTVLMLHPFQNPTRTVLHVHDCDRPGRATRFIYSLAALKVARFIAVSRFVGDHLAQIGVCRAKIEVILTGIEADFADPMSPGPTRPPNSCPRVGIVGQIIQRKGHEDLLEALGLLAERGVSFRCLVFGKGDASFQAQLRHRVSSLGLADRVEWRGFAPRQEIYRQLDLVAVPTRDVEPLGLVALEPAFWGLPVVASRVGGLPEAVSDGVSGCLCAPADPADLADKLEPLLRLPQLRRILGKGARRRALEKFTLDRMIGEIEGLMDRL